MLRPSLLLALILGLVPTLSAQVVRDDFADGDFTSNPVWFGDADHFVVVPFEEGMALRSDGRALSDTLHLVTASTVAAGYWRFRFRHEVNLSTFNGTRVYLVASSPDLKGPLQGYYVQLGTNNLDRIELWRQDGSAAQRVRLGASATLVAGDANALTIEVTRDARSRWTVFADGVPVIRATDATYATSAALGVWVRHSAAGRDRFFWTDFLADALRDVTPPYPVAAIVADEGRALVVEFDREVDPSTLRPEAFRVEPGIGMPVAAQAADSALARLLFAAPLPEGSYRLMVEGVADLKGNVQGGAWLDFVVDRDPHPPVIHSASARDAWTVEVVFNKPVEGCDAALYDVSAGIGRPDRIVCRRLDTYDLVLGEPLIAPRVYTVHARNVPDLLGNVQPQTSASFLFGEFDLPAEREVVINEIMYAPADLPSNEYVELLNRTSDRTIDLSRLRLANASSPLRVITGQPQAIAPGEYVVLVRNPEAFQARYPGVAFVHVVGFPALLNSGDVPRVVREDGLVIDAVPYRPAWGGQGPSLERRDPDGPSHSPTNWGSSTHAAGGTPGAQNAIHEPDTHPPRPHEVVAANDGASLSVAFEEPLDAASVTTDAFSIPSGPRIAGAHYDDGSFSVSLALASPLDPGAHTLAIAGVMDLVGNRTVTTVAFTFNPDREPPRLLDARPLDALTLLVRFDEPVDEAAATTTANYAISHGVGHPAAAIWQPARADRVTLALDRALEGPSAYTLTVRDIADVFGNVRAEQSIGFFFGVPEVPAPGDVVINEIMFHERAGGTEYVELRNLTDRVFNLADFTLADEGAPRTISAEPLLLPPHAHLALARNLEALRSIFGDDGWAIPMPTLASLRNSGDVVVLRFGAMTIDSVYYSPSWHRPELRDPRGVALERLDGALASTDPGNWTSSLDPRGGTPGAPNSVAIGPGAEPAGVGLTVSPSPFDALAGTVIRYRLAAEAASVRIRIFDAAGRAVRTLEHARLAGNATEGEVIWNGRDDRGESLRVGIYIVHLEALDLVGARTETHRATVVLARRFAHD